MDDVTLAILIVASVYAVVIIGKVLGGYSKRQRITVSNGRVTKRVPTGFSWTTLLFGGCPALLRGDLKWAATIFIFGLLTLGVGLIPLAFVYNTRYLEDLYEKGYRQIDG